MKKKTVKKKSKKQNKLSVHLFLIALGIFGALVTTFYSAINPFNLIAKAYSVADVPMGNLIQNPWFRSTTNPTKPGLDQWIDEAGTNVYWSTSQKDSNPTPDNIQGTSARWAFGSGQGGGTGYGGVDARLYQVVQANPIDTTLWFKTQWVTGYIDEADAKIYGSDQPTGPWELVWTPFAVTQATSSNMAWTQTDLLSTQLSSGYSFYKVEFHGRYPSNRNQGFKFTGVYFMSNDGTMPVGGTNPTPTPTPSPTPTVLPTPTPTPTPTVLPTPTPSPIPGNSTPEFTTLELSSGINSKSYLSRIDTIDADTNDTLNISVVGLPNGLSISTCQTATSGTNLIYRCRISGVPTTSGTYSPEFTVTDSHGASTTRVYSLIIN